VGNILVGVQYNDGQPMTLPVNNPDYSPGTVTVGSVGGGQEIFGPAAPDGNSYSDNQQMVMELAMLAQIWAKVYQPSPLAIPPGPFISQGYGRITFGLGGYQVGYG